MGETKDIAVLDLEIEQIQRDLELASLDPTRAQNFQRLGNSYYDRYLTSDADSDFKKVVENRRAALDLTPLDDPSRVDRLFSLAENFYHRSLSSKESIYIDNCIELVEEYQLLIGSEITLPICIHELLASAYCQRWIMGSDDVEAVNKSIELFQQLLVMLPKSDLRHQPILTSLGRLYAFRYQTIGNKDDIETSIQFFQKVVDTFVAEEIKSTERAEALSDLGDAFATKYRTLEVLSDLEESIHLQEEALNALPETSPPSDQYLLLMSLSTAYEDRFRALSSIVDLELGMQVLRRALGLVQDDTKKQPFIYLFLGELHSKRYRRTKEGLEFDQAISCLGRAQKLDPQDRQTIILAFSAMADVYLTRYRMLGNDEDIEESIHRTEEALGVAQDSYKSFQFGLLDFLVDSYQSKFEKTGRIEDIEIAIHSAHKTVNTLSKADPYFPASLFSLSKVYSHKSDKTEKEEDYEMTMKSLHNALNATPKDSPFWSQEMNLLAHEYWQRFGRQKNFSDLNLALDMQETVFNHTETSVASRVTSGSHLTLWLLETHQAPAAYKIITKTLSLISQLTSRSLMVSDKQNLLKSIAGHNIPSTAAAIALMIDKGPYKAISHLEFGRGIIAGALNDLRVDTSSLKLSEPELAEVFVQLAGQLDTDTQLTADLLNPRHKVAKELDMTIERIRRLSDFDSFLVHPSEQELMGAATHGPVVIINLMYLRSDALIIQRSRISSLELPDLYNTDAEEHARKPIIDHDTLEWLWDTAAGPILNALGTLGAFTDSPSSRVTWILTGPLSTLPIHAAGYHYPGSTDTVIDRVISSYSTSVRTLLQSQQSATKLSTSLEFGRSVLVGVQGLYYAPEEIDKIEQLCSEMRLRTYRAQPYREEVLSALADCEIFHFAGHGKTDPSDPTKSSLNMNDAPVTVQDLFNMKLHERAPFLAYLSACSTGLTADTELVDEGLHLIGAFQLAGFRNVIGTLRAVEDRHCIEVARKTYQWIKDCNLSDTSVAEGLHYAVLNLRDQWMVDKEKSVNRQNALQKEELRGTQGKLISGMERGENPGGVRDIITCDNELVYWALFVYFGI